MKKYYAQCKEPWNLISHDTHTFPFGLACLLCSLFQHTSISGSWDCISFSLLLTQRLTVKLLDLICCEWRGLSLLLPFTLICFYLLFSQTTRPAYLYRLLKPSLSILFESGPIRTHVCLCTEQAGKQTNKQV